MPIQPEERPGQEPERPAVESEVEDYLRRLAAGEPVELEEYRARLPDAGAWSCFAVAATSAEILWRRERGEEVDRERYLARLPSEEDRRSLVETLDGATRTEELLPGSLVPGTLLQERYEILREVGRGGMGIVYAALDRELEREVALKVFNFEAASVAGDWEEIVREESKSLAKLRSPNIVTVHDAQRGEERSFIVMDLVRGRSLHEVIERAGEELRRGARRDGELLRRAIGLEADDGRARLIEPRSFDRSVARIVRDVAWTLELAHGEGIVHRDVKPKNVLLQAGGVPVLLDFGLASRLAEASGEEAFRGTPEYVAPEQARELRAGSDPRTDVYQLGLVLYEMLTLERAFVRRKGEELLAFLERVGAGSYRAPREVEPAVPRALEAVVQKALEPDPARRYAGAAEMRADLELVSRGLPPRHAPLARRHALALRSRHAARHPVTLVVLASFLAFFLARQWLAEWAPPVMRAWYQQVGMEGPADILGPRHLTVHDAAVLGVTVESPADTYLYVFSLFGGPSSEDQFLRPERPEHYPPPLDPPTAARPEPIRVEAGESRVVCSWLSPESFHPFEGLLVYATPERNEFFDAWQEALVGLGHEELGDVALDRAMELGRNLLADSRGRSLAELPLEDRNKLFGSAPPSGEESQDTWRRHGIKPFSFLIEVRANGE